MKLKIPSYGKLPKIPMSYITSKKNRKGVQYKDIVSPFRINGQTRGMHMPDGLIMHITECMKAGRGGKNLWQIKGKTATAGLCQRM